MTCSCSRASASPISISSRTPFAPRPARAPYTRLQSGFRAASTPHTRTRDAARAAAAGRRATRGVDADGPARARRGDARAERRGRDDDGRTAAVRRRGAAARRAGRDRDGTADRGRRAVRRAADGRRRAVRDGTAVRDGRGDGDGDGTAADGRTTDAGTVSRDGDHAPERTVAGFVADVRAEGAAEVVRAAGETEKDAADAGGGGVREGV